MVTYFGEKIWQKYTKFLKNRTTTKTSPNSKVFHLWEKPISKNPFISSCGNLNGNAICWPKCSQTFLPFQVSCHFVCAVFWVDKFSELFTGSRKRFAVCLCRPKGLAKAFTSKSTNSFSWLWAAWWLGVGSSHPVKPCLAHIGSVGRFRKQIASPQTKRHWRHLCKQE